MKPHALIWLTLLSFLPTYGQRFRVTDMGVKKGLSQSTVQAIVHSKEGFLWVGTQDGLNRFDGYDYEVFRYRPNQTNVLNGNFIGALYEDSKGIMWVGDLDRGGVTRYDPVRQRFTQVKDEEGKRFDVPINAIREDDLGNIWLGTHRDVFFIENAVEEGVSPDSLKARFFGLSKGMGAVNELVLDKTGKMWFGSNITSKTGTGHLGGIGIIDPEKMSLDSSLWNPLSKGLLPDNQVNCLYLDREEKLWVGTVDSGLYVCENPWQRHFVGKRVYHAQDHKRIIGDEFIHVLEEDRHGNLWVGTHRGFFIMPRGKRDSLYQVTFTNRDKLSLEAIRDISEDRYGNIWIGASNGCLKLNRTPSDFAHHYHIPGNPNSIASNDALTILERKNGEIWVGLGDKGISRMIPDKKGYRYIHYNEENGTLPTNLILGLREDQEGQVWAASFVGLFVFSFEDEQTGSKASIRNLRHEPGNPNSLGSNYLYNVLPNKDGSYWVSDYLAGASLLRLDGKKLTRKSFGFKKGDPFSFTTGYTMEVMKDYEDRLWVMGKRGISLMYMENDSFQGYRHIFNENFREGKGLPGAPMSFYRDKEGNLWVGANGLNKISLKDNWKLAPGRGEVSDLLPFDLTYYGKDEGLENNLIYFIQPDRKGILWLGTNGGMIRFDPQKESFKTYTREDGFQSNEFSGDASFLGKDGLIYAGGINGFNVFHPDSLRESKDQPRVVIEKLLLFGEEATPGKTLQNSSFVMKEAIQTSSQLNLTYRDKVLGFEFGTDAFTAPEKQVFQYRIPELDAGWVSLNKQRGLTLTNLPPGRYSLELRTSNVDGIWSDKIHELDINIAPPWWQRSWFYILLSFLLGGLVYLLVVLRIRAVRREERVQARLSQAKIEEREQTRAETSRDFHDEAGNRITKIGLYANLLRESVGEKEEPLSFIEKIEDHTRELSARMRDFIWVLDPKQDELGATLTRIRDFGVNLFEHTNIQFDTSGAWGKVPRLRLEVQVKRHLLMIAKEAFHNALKYADCSQVEMKLVFEEEHMIWEITDDGLGFNIEEASQGMGLRNMKNRAEELHADFSIDSQPGLGTQIKLKLNLNGSKTT